MILWGTMPQTPSADYERARAILEDHRRGLHEVYETENGCRYPGCDEAFWTFARESEQE